MKVFISQPMVDKTDEEIKAARSFAKDCVSMYFPKEDIEVIDSFFKMPQGTSPICHLGKSIEKLAEADLVYFVRGWNKYRGCSIENTIAKQYGLIVVEENYDGDGNVVLSKYEGTTKVQAGYPKRRIKICQEFQ